MKKIAQFIKQNKNLILPLILSIFIAASCEKDITVDLPASEKKIVVDGKIFQGEHPYVALTYTFPFFEPLSFDITDLNSLGKYLVLDATVIVSDGLNSDYLTLSIDTTKFPPLIYKADSLIGEAGKIYDLKILVQGKTFTSQTSIPFPVVLDSIDWRPDGDLDTLGAANLYFQEPPAYGNIYRLFCKRQGYPDYVPTFNPSTLDDQLYNGQYIEYPFYRPNPQSRSFTGSSDSLSEQQQKEEFYWKKGDSIYVKFCTVDRSTLEFVRTYEQAASTSGNPFSNPTTVKSNIVGTGAMGGWCGYGVYKTVRVAE